MEYRGGSVHGDDKGDDDGGNSSEDKEDGKMSRSERKRLWRKNLSADKLAKLRERDALRKRVERQNMSAEKRRDLRTKDTARKAALRRERRMNESGGTEPASSDVGAGGAGSTDHVRGSSHGARPHDQLGERSSRGKGGRGDGSHGSSRRSGYTKIPVHTLLN